MVLPGGEYMTLRLRCFWLLPITMVFAAVLVTQFQFGSGVSVEEDLTLTLAEKKALDKFKVKMIPLVPHEYMKQDIYLIRWLRATNLNLDAAMDMLQQNLRWRKENRMDSINQQDWSDMRDEYEYSIDTVDKKGRPIGTISIGSWDARKAVLAGKGQRLLRYLDNILEEITQQLISVQSRGGNVTQWTAMLNMEGFNLPQHACPRCLPLYISLVTSVEQHYPGMQDQILLINTPPAFQVVLELVRPIFSAQTRKALRIFGNDKKGWGSYLDKTISREERRPEFGGIKRD